MSVALEEVRHDINAKIQAHFKAIVDLRKNLNALAPISRLPPELLGAIFLLVRDASKGNARCHPRSSQVCASWRAVALGCKPLWTEINCARPMWANELMSRAGNSVLSVNASLGFARCVVLVYIQFNETKAKLRIAEMI